jgi:hypothetical protein
MTSSRTVTGSVLRLKIELCRLNILAVLLSFFKTDTNINLKYVSHTVAISGDRVLFPALPEILSSGSGTGSTQPREYN